MRIIISIFLLCTLLTSCSYGIYHNVSIYNNVYAIIDNKIFYGEDAIVAYDFYNEMYENDSVNFSKPIIFEINKK